MPWEASNVVDKKKEFAERYLREGNMAELCREFGVQRKTGYAVVERYRAEGVKGLEARSRAPKHIPHKTQQELLDVIVELRKAHPTWGPKKLKRVLEQKHGKAFPAASTIGGCLKRAGLSVARPSRGRAPPRPTGLTDPQGPNDVWCADYKGQFRVGDGTYCYPLTMTDQFSRYLLTCDGMPAINEDDAIASSLTAFDRYGLPKIIRSDNGVPFASTGVAALSKLSALWIRLGVVVEHIAPGHPEQNGRHERMHRTLKAETTRPPGANLVQQQERFDKFTKEFNDERPHEALGQRTPNEFYQRSERGLPERLPHLNYPMHDDVVAVQSGGHIRFGRRRTIFVAKALAGHDVGLREEDDGRWLISFAYLDLGHLDTKTMRFKPI